MGSSIRRSATAVIPFPERHRKLIAVAHTRLKYGGGWSYFICPDAPRSRRRSTPSTTSRSAGDAVTSSTSGIAANGAWAARSACEPPISNSTGSSPSSKPMSRCASNRAPASWQGKARLVYRSRRLTQRMRRRMITLRLSQLASQQPTTRRPQPHPRLHAPQGRPAAIPELGQVWRARSTECLEQALDNAQSALLKALESNDPRQRLSAARLMLKTKQGRERGFRT